MGLELKLTAQREGSVSLFTGPDRLALLESLQSKATEYSPNLFRATISLAIGGLCNQRVKEYLEPRIHKRYSALSRLLGSASQTADRLQQLAVSGTGNVDEIVARDLLERGRLARHFNKLRKIDNSKIDMYPTETVELGMKGIILAVLYANNLYEPGKRLEFLQHVKFGVVDAKHQEAMLAPYLA
ncbi:hypothetical protein HYU17_06000 [Candidatus Woesearchaeota archaeon]|nr:hypothetical protein [Candidatus Woesearchaeota archaeon]